MPTSVRHIPPSDFKTTPWKNGGGVTSEIAIHPPGATLDHFQWRISSAVVSEAGPFSTFAGCTRQLVVIEGDGLVLRVPDREKALRPLDVFTFDGADSVSCRLVGGPVRDFNVIVKNKGFAAKTEVLRSNRAGSLAEGTYLIFCVSGEADLELPAQARLRPLEAALVTIDRGESATFQLKLRESVCLFVTVTG